MLRNKNIDPVSAKNMSYRPELKHLTVIGFTNSTSNTDLAKKGIAKLQKAKANIVDAASDLSEAFKLTIEQFKADVVIKINETEHKIADFKRKHQVQIMKLLPFTSFRWINLKQAKPNCCWLWKHTKKKAKVNGNYLSINSEKT